MQARLKSGKLQCWGDNSYGQLGVASVTQSLQPVNVPGVTGVTSISTGDGNTCVLLSNGTASCWGSNRYGATGSDLYSSTVALGTLLPLKGVQFIATNGYDTCAVIQGAVLCWGSNSTGYRPGNTDAYGYLGTGDQSSQYVLLKDAKPVPGISSAVSVVVAGYHVCVLLSNSTVSCWGDNSVGQLGNTNVPSGFKVNSVSLVPVSVQGLSGVKQIVASSIGTCALLANGTVKCWGYLGGILLTSTSIDGVSNAVSIAASGGINNNSACALLSSGEVRCWGMNNDGELGNGNTSVAISQAAVSVLKVSGAVALGGSGGGGSGYDYCTINSSGLVQCWGKNDSGVLGVSPNALKSSATALPITFASP